MSEPSLELQRAIYQALITSDALKAAMGGTVRAYDRVPPTPVTPYITFSEAQVLDDGNTCDAEHYEIFVDLHIWSRAVGMAEVKTIAGVLRGLMLALELATDWNIPIREVQTIRHLNDPDGLTTHSVVTVRFLLETVGA